MDISRHNLWLVVRPNVRHTDKWKLPGGFELLYHRRYNRAHRWRVLGLVVSSHQAQ